MSEPIKPRIDFAGPLEVEQNPAFKAQQTFTTVKEMYRFGNACLPQSFD